mgnify:CR=1 FL=1
MGARPMARVIQNHIKKPMANELLFGSLSNGGTVTVNVATGTLSSYLTATTSDVVTANGAGAVSSHTEDNGGGSGGADEREGQT